MEFQPAIAFADIGRSFVTLVAQSGPFAKFILLVLFVLSIISWAIILDRSRLYRKLRKRGRVLQTALEGKGLAVPLETVRRCIPSVEAALLLEAKQYLGRDSEAANPMRMAAAASHGVEPHRFDAIIGGLKDLLDRRASAEVAEMEKYLVFLGTTTTVAPFLGLLGTVWGVMTSFLSMGVEGSASIEVVGPGIAEALVTTIAGLAAAITSLVGYNVLVRHVHREENRIELFVSRILSLAGSRLAARPAVEREVSYEEKPI